MFTNNKAENTDLFRLVVNYYTKPEMNSGTNTLAHFIRRKGKRLFNDGTWLNLMVLVPSKHWKSLDGS